MDALEIKEIAGLRGELDERATTQYVDGSDRALQQQLDALDSDLVDLENEQLQQENRLIAVEQALPGKAAKTYVDAADAALQQQLNGKAALEHAHTSTSILDFQEAVQDAVAAFMRSGANVTLSYDDANNTYTVSAAAGDQFDPERTRDAIGAALLGLGLITVAINDAGDTIAISTTATQNQTDAYLLSRANHTGTQPASTITGLPFRTGSAGGQGDLIIGDAGNGCDITGEAISVFNLIVGGSGSLIHDSEYCCILNSDDTQLMNCQRVQVFGGSGLVLSNVSDALYVNGERYVPFIPIVANQFGTHPEFTAQAPLHAYLLGNSGTGNPTEPTDPPADPPAAAPTDLSVDPGRNATFTPAGGKAATAYEYRLGSGVYQALPQPAVVGSKISFLVPGSEAVVLYLRLRAVGAGVPGEAAVVAVAASAVQLLIDPTFQQPFTGNEFTGWVADSEFQRLAPGQVQVIGGSTKFLFQRLPLEAGRSYYVRVEVTSYTSGGLDVGMIGAQSGFIPPSLAQIRSAGTHAGILTAPAASNERFYLVTNDNTNMVFSRFSCQLLD